MPHHDASTFTVNIALNRVGEDYEVSQGLGAQREGPGEQRVQGLRGKWGQVCGEGFLEEWDQGTARQEPEHKLQRVWGSFCTQPSASLIPVSCNRFLDFSVSFCFHMRCENKSPGHGLIRNPNKYSMSDRNWSGSLGFSL